MATAMITKKQLQEINNKCSSNWRFDTTFFVFHSVKSLFKKLKVDNTGYYEFRLYYNNQNQITLNIKKFDYKDNVTVAGETKSIILNEKAVAKRTPSKLLNFTEKLTDERLQKYVQRTSNQK